MVNQLEQELADLSIPIERITVTLEDFSQECKNVAEFGDFLKDLFLPKVVKDGSIYIYANTILNLIFGGNYSKYYIRNAKDTSQARSLGDMILTFFKKHRVSLIFNSMTPWLLSSPLVIGLAATVLPIVLSIYRGTVLPFRGVFVFGAICIVILIAYIIWSQYTTETPSASFFHCIIWLEKSKSNIP